MAVLSEEARARFRLVRESEFGREHLDEYPVWSEFYDFEERDEIVGWGVDGDWLDAELARVHDGSNHAMYPLPEVDPFPPRMRIYIRARFRTAGGQHLDGYVVNEDADPAVGVFLGADDFVFNRHLRGWYTPRIEVLRRSLPDLADPTFPLTYETDFLNEDGKRIAGSFDFDPE